MTTIETDNPIIQFRMLCYDLIWHYWPVVLLVFILAVWLMFRHFSRRQKEWELNQQRMHRKDEELREQIRKYNSPIERDLYEKDIIEIKPEQVKPITPHNHV